MELTPEPAADLAHNLLKRIEEFHMHSTEVSTTWCHLVYPATYIYIYKINK